MAGLAELERYVRQVHQVALDSRRVVDTGGAVGPAGPAGADGAPGAPGAPGADGADGADGLDAVLGIFLSGTEPAASADNAGRFILVTAVAAPTRVLVAGPNSSGGYEWIPVGQSS